MQEYVIEINGIEHTVQLSDEDAKARGLKADRSAEKAAPAPKNKARTTVSNKEG